MSDASKINPVRIDKLGEADGVASLNSSGKIPDSQLPTKAVNSVQKTGDTMTGTLTLDLRGKGGAALTLANTGATSNFLNFAYNLPLSDENLIARIYTQRTDNDNSLVFQLFGNESGTINGASALTILRNRQSGIPILKQAQSPEIGSNDTTIPTTAWVTDKIESLSSVGSKAIGEVFYSQSNTAAENPGALPLWTGEYYSNASSLYPDFYTWVKKHTELCKTKVEYDSIISTYGECPYYVIDEIAGSLRLPKLANYIKMANSTDGITQKSAGLPEHDHIMHGKGAIAGVVYLSNNAAAYGRSGGETVGKSGTPATTMRTGDASESNSIYGNSTTVTPAHTTLYPWVYAFNSSVSASEAQAAEFTGALSGKANTDLSNVSSTVKASLLDLLAMDTTRGVSLPSGTTLTQNGWIVCSFTDSNYGVAQFQLDGVTTFQWSFQSAANTRKGTCYGGKGQVFTITTSGNCTAVATFYPLKGD